MTFSELLEKLGVSSSHLTYHLENLGELVSKTDDGKYKLSAFGVASVKTMMIVEEASPAYPNRGLSLSLKWKSVFAVLFIGVLLLASMSYIQYASLGQLSEDYNHLELAYDRLLSWNTGTDSAIIFLQNIAQIDITEYEATLLSDTVEHRSDLGVVEEIVKYSLVSNQGTADVVFRFRDKKLSRYQLNLFEGVPIFSQPQSSNLLDATRNLLERFKFYSDAPYLEEMDDILSSINEIKNMEVTEGNIKLKITLYGNNVAILWLYTENGVDFSAKSLRFVFENHLLKEVTDGWFLFTAGSTNVDISMEEAINISKTYVQEEFTWEYGGTVVSDFVVVDDPVSAEFAPHPREEPLVLVPFWFVTLYLDKVYPGEVSRIGVGLWGDTGEVVYVKAMSG